MNKYNVYLVHIIYKYNMSKIKIREFNEKIKSLIDNKKYKIISSYNGHIIKGGRYSGIYKNPYWLVYDEEDEKEKEYYLLHIKNDIFTKISKESINEIHNKWETNLKKITWGINKKGYITGYIHKLKKSLLLHQVITNYYSNGKGTINSSIDHINRQKLDNRKCNLRIVDFITQQNNTKGIIKGTKRERKHNAQQLPDGITQEMIPKYCNYNTEVIKATNGDYTREFFRIEKHPKLKKKCWCSSKSCKVSILDKLEEAKQKIKDLDNDVPEEIKIIPKYVRLLEKDGKKYLIYDRRINGKRQNVRFRFKDELEPNIELIKNKVLDKYGVVL